MANFNRVILIGNLTRDPELKYLPNSNTAVASFGMAVNRKYTVNGEQREDVLFIDCSAFGKSAENISKYCTKGKPLFVEGRLKLDTWEDRNGGGKRSKISVVVDGFQFLGSRDGGQAQEPHDAGDDVPGSVDVPPVERRTRGPSSRPVPHDAPRTKFQNADIPFAWEGRTQQDV